MGFETDFLASLPEPERAAWQQSFSNEETQHLATFENKYMKKYLQKGLCKQGCGRPLVSKTLCQFHLEKMKENNKERTTQFLSQGLCSKCGKNPLQTKLLCMECEKEKINYMNRVRAEKISKGICSYSGCNEPRSKLLTCNFHAEKHRISSRNWKRAKALTLVSLPF